MVFSSYTFLFLFLPIVWLGHRLLASRSGVALAWLCACSLVFYGFWNVAYVPLIVGSASFNYVIANHVIVRKDHRSKPALIFGVACNLGLIGYYKYAHFVVDNANHFLGANMELGAITLPLAISFFTFQQIAYLVDVYRGEAVQGSPLRYGLFVVFFPQLIAGPIVHHREMVPQFGVPFRHRFEPSMAAKGVYAFSLGLFKKAVIADNLAPFVDQVFGNAEAGQTIVQIDAICATLLYTFQLYFDFSGYADMAIGLGLLFGLRIPRNFDSPYKASSVIDFWRRWHMTLSAFLKDYLYIPLGGNRRGRPRRRLNLMITMLLGGIWHGAGWSFLVWGGLHGSYLLINHFAQEHRGAQQAAGAAGPRHAASTGLTFIAVTAAWVVFRAPTLSGAGNMYAAMLGQNGSGELALAELVPTCLAVLTEPGAWLRSLALATGLLEVPAGRCLVALLLLALTMLAPNTAELTERYRPGLRHGLFVSTALGLSLWQILFSGTPSEFLYFDF